MQSTGCLTVCSSKQEIWLIVDLPASSLTVSRLPIGSPALRVLSLRLLCECSLGHGNKEAATKVADQVMSKKIRRGGSLPAKVKMTQVVGLAAMAVVAIFVLLPLVGWVFSGIMALLMFALKVALGIGAIYLLYKWLTRDRY